MEILPREDQRRGRGHPGRNRTISMRRALGGAALLALLLSCSFSSALAQSDPECHGLSPVIPEDIAPDAPQDQFDEYGWKLFVALNWPSPNVQDACIGQAPDVARVWEEYADPFCFFRPNEVECKERRPDAPDSMPYFDTDKETLGTLSDPHLETHSDPHFSSLQAASGWPLIDQDGNFAVNEIRIDPKLAGYLEENDLNIPEIVCSRGPENPIDMPLGSLTLKAGWRVIPPGFEYRKRYYVRKKSIHIRAGNTKDRKPLTVTVELGLTALHIVQKTKNHPGWIWATFEQVDNYSISKEAKKLHPKLEPSFNSGGVKEGSRRANRQPEYWLLGVKPNAYYWRSDPPYAFDYGAPEVARCPNEPEIPKELNDGWHAKLRKVAPDTPWQYYRLNVVQWLTPEGRPRPLNKDGVSIARNSVLETYLLGAQTLAAQVPPVGAEKQTYPAEVGANNPQSTLAELILQTIKTARQPETTGPATWSSCVLCHQLAVATFRNRAQAIVRRVATDSTFLFQTFLQEEALKEDCSPDTGETEGRQAD